MSTCSANTLGIGAEDSVLPVVPMFHANAWGLPYAALMAGADLVLTDRFLDAKSVIDVIETQRPTVAGAVVFEHQLNGFGGAIAAPIAKQLMQVAVAGTGAARVGPVLLPA